MGNWRLWRFKLQQFLVGPRTAGKGTSCLKAVVDWGQLTPEEQYAAAQLGSCAKIWDAASREVQMSGMAAPLSPPAPSNTSQRAVSPQPKLQAQQSPSVSSRAVQRPVSLQQTRGQGQSWDSLSPEAAQAAAALGWSKEKWDRSDLSPSGSLA